MVSDIIVDGHPSHHFDPFAKPVTNPPIDADSVHHQDLPMDSASFLIFFAICAAACVGLWALFRRRLQTANKIPNPRGRPNK
jgi:hypothetical protein